ncbi:MAG: hypothetical protein A2075_12110 [Geobacteraceae bacterium GWC2_58_44]|nr:MAG: hypothetical protein A2075_12110 [Geobacteraceae bacterium GWC2_58_44]HBG06306.1 hypothetical protein [Geobacter sp.]
MSGDKPTTPTEWHEWREQLRKKNGFLVLSKRDRAIIDQLIVDKTLSLGPRNPPRPPGDNPRA